MHLPPRWRLCLSALYLGHLGIGKQAEQGAGRNEGDGSWESEDERPNCKRTPCSQVELQERRGVAVSTNLSMS